MGDDTTELMTPAAPILGNVGSTLIGLANRTNHNLTIELEKDSLVIPPARRTSKEFKQSSILSINGVSLNEAVSTGKVAIIR